MAKNPDQGVRSRALETPKAIREKERQVFFPLRARIVGVAFTDTTQGKRTYVDLYVYDGWPALYGVPLMHGKINASSGEQWAPEEGDEVAVSFFGGNINDPVVIGYMPPPSNGIEAKTTEAPRYHRSRSKTSETIDKSGNRTTIVEGHETTSVETGDLTVTVKQGKCTVSVKGKTVWTSEGTVEHIGKAGGVAKGNVQGDCICPLIKRPHIMRSETVKSSL